MVYNLDMKNLNFKYVFLVIVVFIVCSCFYFSIPAFADSNLVAGNPQYARVKNSNVKLYKTATENEDFSNVYFTIPETYFVELLAYENDLFFSARYLDAYGYVKISDVQCVKGVPANAFVSKASFRVFAPNGIELRTSPSQSDGLNTICNINFLETNLQFYGTISGEEAIAYKGSEWYFCKYTKSGVEQKGYVYSVFCDLLTTISANTEVLEYVSEPTFETENTSAPSQDVSNDLSSMPSITQILIIVAVCIPVILIIYLLFRPTRITAKAFNKSGKKQKRKQDYYEYEE